MILIMALIYMSCGINALSHFGEKKKQGNLLQTLSYPLANRLDFELVTYRTKDFPFLITGIVSCRHVKLLSEPEVTEFPRTPIPSITNEIRWKMLRVGHPTLQRNIGRNIISSRACFYPLPCLHAKHFTTPLLYVEHFTKSCTDARIHFYI